MNPTQLLAFRDEYTKLAAKKKKDQRTFPISRLLRDEVVSSAVAGGKGLAGGAATGGIIGGGKGALIGGAGGGISMALMNAIQSRALLGRSRTKQKGIGGSEKKILKALRADKSSRKGSTNPISRAFTSPITGGIIGATPGLLALSAVLGSRNIFKKGLGINKVKIKSFSTTQKKRLKQELAIAGAITAGSAGLGALTPSIARVITARSRRGENRVGRKKSYSQGLGLFRDDTAQTKILKALKKAKD